MSSSRNFYQVLEIEKNATLPEIKKAYRKLMLQFHPDKYKGDKETGSALVTEIVRAYEILSDEKLRVRYDAGETNFIPSNTDTKNEEKPSTSKYQRPRKARDPNAPLEIGFDFEAFMGTLSTLASLKDPIAFENYVIENINDVQAHIKNGYPFKEICRLFERADSFHLVKQFDSNWLKTLEHFNRPEFLGIIFNHFYIENGIILLDHLGADWIKSLISGERLKELMGNLTGYPGMDTISYRDEQVKAILNYLSQVWLRELFQSHFQLGCFLKGRFYNNCEKLTLSFIDGDDQWISKTITRGTQLGIVLDKMVEYQEQHAPGMRGFFVLAGGLASPPQPEQLREFVLPNWKTFLEYLDPQWQDKIANNPVELNALLFEMDKHFGGRHKTKAVELFLTNFFHPQNVTSFIQLISIITSKDVEIGALEIAKSLQVMQAFSDQQMQQIIFEDKIFKEALTDIDVYKEQPFYQALLYAAAKGYHFSREQNQNEKTSSWGKSFGYARQDKLAAAKSLMQAILDNKDIDTKVAGISQGQLGDISSRYHATRPKHGLSGIHVFTPSN